VTGESLYPRDLIERLRGRLDEHEAWARAASRTYRYADEGATVPEGGVHWRWVHGDNWDTTNPDPVVEEWVGGEPGAPVNLATVEEWTSSSRLDDGTVVHTRQVPLAYANEIVEMDPAAAGLIQRYDPAHVLRTIQAHRQIVELHEGSHECSQYDHNGDVDRCTWVHEGDICSTLAAVASIYFPESDG
jgi:hypothetical protein